MCENTKNILSLWALQKHSRGCIWPMGHRLPTPDLKAG